MKQNLPAGIEGPGIEIYRNDKFQVFFLQDGTKKPFRELPADVVDLLREELNNDLIAKAALLKLISTNDDDLLLEMVAGCRYGNLDYTPDFVSGKLNREVPSCPLVKTCSNILTCFECTIQVFMTLLEKMKVESIAMECVSTNP